MEGNGRASEITISFLKMNGEAIYGTRPFKKAFSLNPKGFEKSPLGEIYYTCKGGAIYAFLLAQPPLLSNKFVLIVFQLTIEG